MYYVAYNPALGNALVGVSYKPFDNLPEGLMQETLDGSIPDLTKYIWSEGSLNFVLDPSLEARVLTQTEFMRRFTQEERLQIRGVVDSDLVIKDALELMAGTKDGVNLDDPDVGKTLQYLAYVKNIIAPSRIQEILS
jgi:hypothetical protein